jgi:hypothetical protein
MPITKATASSIAPAAKGDLVVGSATNDASVLAVGSNGDTLLADSAATTGLRWSAQPSASNPVINGAFDVWQRGTSFVPSTTGGTSYTADRWSAYRNATGSTVNRQTVSDSTNLPNIQYAIRVQRDSGNSSTQGILLGNPFEIANSIPFAGKTVTLSFYARAGANYSAASSALAVVVLQGTGSSETNPLFSGYTGQSAVLNTTSTLTTTWQRFSHTFSFATTATQFMPYFQTTPVGTASTNDWFELTGVQIDVGSVALPFRRSANTLQGELAACQRYFQIIADGSGQSISMLAAYSSTNAYGVYQSKVTMRTTPTIYQVSGTNYFLILGNGLDNDTFDSVTALENGSSNAVRFSITSGISMTQGYSYWFQTNNASARLGLQAEL